MKKTADNIAKVRARIQQALHKKHENKQNICLLAASKTRNPAEIRLAHQAGIYDFGENYLQEALPKIKALSGIEICWHFIGPLQSNKSKEVAEHFAWFHALDRLKIAQKLHQHRPANMPPLNICIQVNINEENSKSGITPSDLNRFISSLLPLSHLQIRGLMAIPEPQQSQDRLESTFAKMEALLQQCQQQFSELTLDTLSMGMSADLELAIAHGATIIRVGTAIFGERN